MLLSFQAIFNKYLVFLGVLFLSAYSTILAQTGYSDVTISTSATSSGTWSGDATSGYVFAPSADNANINVADITNRMDYETTTVSITTVNSTGTQQGSIYVVSNLSARNYSTSSNKGRLVLDAHGNIEVSSFIDVGPSSYVNAGYRGHDLYFKAIGDIHVGSYLRTRYSNTSGSYNLRFGASGNITLEAGGAISTTYLYAEGLDNTYVGSAAYAGSAGSVSLLAGGGITMNQGIDLSGGTSSYTSSHNGTYGDITISTGTSSVTSGGSNDGQVSGAIITNNFTKEGSGILKLNGTNVFTGAQTISSGTLLKGSSGAMSSGIPLVLNGVLDLNGLDHTAASFNGTGRVTSSQSGNVLFTVTGGGTYTGILEDGSGVLSFTKQGGVLTLGGNNTYTGLSYLTGGTRLTIAHSNALGSTLSSTIVNVGSTLYLSGDIEVAEAITIQGKGVSNNTTYSALNNSSGDNVLTGLLTIGSGYSSVVAMRMNSGSLTLSNTTSINNTSNASLYVYGNGILTIKGSMDIGSGHFNRYDNGRIILEGANTSTGNITVGDGELMVRHSNALGDTTGTTSVSNGASLLIDGGISLAAEPITITGTGHNTQGALVSSNGSNTMSGTLTSNNATINTSSSSLSLGASTALAGSTTTFTGTGSVTLGGLVTSSKLILSGGSLHLGGDNYLSDSLDMVFDGGSLYTNGYTDSLDELQLTADSDLVLGSGSHSLTYSKTTNFNFNKLTIKNWQGTYGGSGSSGTAGRLIISSGTAQDYRDQMQFYNSADSKDYYALQISGNELVPGTDRVGNATGYSNVRISTNATSGGAWSGDATSGYVFAPSADNANINVADIVNRMDYETTTVSITTVNSTGTQQGSIYVVSNLSARNYSTSSNKGRLVLDAHGNIEVSSSIDVGPSSYVNAGYRGHDLYFKAIGDIHVGSYLRTRYSNTSGSYNVRFGASGNITLEAGGDISTTYLYAEGLDNTYVGSAAYAGMAGSVSLLAGGGITMNQGIDLTGGTSSYTSSHNGTYGDITISTGTSSVTSGGSNDGQVSGAIITNNFTKEGNGAFNIKSASITYLKLNAGALHLGTSNAINSSAYVYFQGGDLHTQGYANTFYRLYVSSNSHLYFGSGAHTLTFSGKGSLSANLTMHNWQGTYGAPGATATEGKLVINTTLTATDLGYLFFINPSDSQTHTALQITGNEIVPGDL